MVRSKENISASSKAASIHWFLSSYGSYRPSVEKSLVFLSSASDTGYKSAFKITGPDMEVKRCICKDNVCMLHVLLVKTI